MGDYDLARLDQVVTYGALASSQVIYNAGLVLFDVEGFNDAASVIYWQLFAGTTAPSNGASPAFSIRIPAGGSFDWAPMGGYLIGTGGSAMDGLPIEVRNPGAIWVASTTPAVLTLATTAVLYCRVLFMPENAVPT